MRTTKEEEEKASLLVSHNIEGAMFSDKNERLRDAMDVRKKEPSTTCLRSPTPRGTQTARSLVWAQAAWHDSRKVKMPALVVERENKKTTSEEARKKRKLHQCCCGCGKGRCRCRGRRFGNGRRVLSWLCYSKAKNSGWRRLSSLNRCRVEA